MYYKQHKTPGTGPRAQKVRDTLSQWQWHATCRETARNNHKDLKKTSAGGQKTRQNTTPMREKNTLKSICKKQTWVTIKGIILLSDWPSVLKEACAVSHPRLLHTVQVYRPLSSFVTRWIVRLRFCWFRVTPARQPDVLFCSSCNSWSKSVFSECLTWALHNSVVVFGPGNSRVWRPSSHTAESDCRTYSNLLVSEVIKDPWSLEV